MGALPMAFPGVLVIAAFPGTLLIGAVPSTLLTGAFPDLLTGAPLGISMFPGTLGSLPPKALPGDFTAVGFLAAA